MRALFLLSALLWSGLAVARAGGYPNCALKEARFLVTQNEHTGELPNFTLSPEWYPGVSQYRYTVDGRLNGLVQAGVIFTLDNDDGFLNDATVELAWSQGGDWNLLHVHGDDKNERAGSWPFTAAQDLCMDVRVRVSGSTCTARTYRFKCVHPSAAESSTAPAQGGQETESTGPQEWGACPTIAWTAGIEWDFAFDLDMHEYYGKVRRGSMVQAMLTGRSEGFTLEFNGETFDLSSGQSAMFEVMLGPNSAVVRGPGDCAYRFNIKGKDMTAESSTAPAQGEQEASTGSQPETPVEGGDEVCVGDMTMLYGDFAPAFSKDVLEYTCADMHAGAKTVLMLTADSGAHHSARRRLFRFRPLTSGESHSQEGTEDHSHPESGEMVSGGLSVTYNGQSLELFEGGVKAKIWVTAGPQEIVVRGHGSSCPTYTIRCDVPAVGEMTSSGGAEQPGEMQQSSSGAAEPLPSESCAGAKLSGLVVGSVGALAPPFSPSVYEYTCGAAADVFMATVIASVLEADLAAKLTLVADNQTQTLASGVESASVRLVTGWNDLKVVVSVGEGEQACMHKYRIRCTRAAVAAGSETPATYNWNLSGYDSCNGTCATETSVATAGVIQRTITCMSESGELADDSKCPQPKPASAAVCQPICEPKSVVVIDDPATRDGDNPADGVNVRNPAAVTQASPVLLIAAIVFAIVARLV